MEHLPVSISRIEGASLGVTQSNSGGAGGGDRVQGTGDPRKHTAGRGNSMCKAWREQERSLTYSKGWSGWHRCVGGRQGVGAPGGGQAMQGLQAVGNLGILFGAISHGRS